MVFSLTTAFKRCKFFIKKKLRLRSVRVALVLLLILPFYQIMQDYVNLTIPATCVQKHYKQSHTSIPSLLHYIWIKLDSDSTMSEMYKSNINTCSKLNSSYKLKIWTEGDILNFLYEHYQWFVPNYLSYSYQAQKNDVARYLILHHFGGVYLDMDVICHTPFDQIISNVIKLKPNMNIIMQREDIWQKKFNGNVGVVSNVMVAKPKSPFLKEVIYNLEGFNRQYFTGYLTVVLASGPWYLARIYSKFPCKDQVYLLPTDQTFLKHQFTGTWKSDKDQFILVFSGYVFLTYFYYIVLGIFYAIFPWY